ncbi:MAG: hypothetical protein JXR41_04575 [Bacteroidales bacterium]|nr:hypothetical protein [Bacteroidales bacterium]MBN2762345.1 hypothetical protein [Bacteroidales bacterium]
MHKLPVLFILLFFVVPGYAQVNPFISLGGGYDYNLNKYYDENNYTGFEGHSDFNAGLHLGTTLGKRIRFRTSVNYAQFTYGRNPMNEQLYISESTMRISNINLNPMLDGCLFLSDKFNLYLYAGYRFEWVVDSYEESIVRETGKTKDTRYIDRNYTTFNNGPLGGIILKYKAGKHLAFTFEPGFTYFLKEFYYQNDGNLQRISANIGIEWQFLVSKPKKKTDVPAL